MVTAGPLRIVFFGTPHFAVPTLEALLRSGHSVVSVVTQPDRPRDRGQRVSESPIKTVAQAFQVPVLQPDKLRDERFLQALSATVADLGVVAAYGKILTEAVLGTPRLGLINVHASLLPRYRGAAPVHRAVINGDSETGVTIMRMVRALDAGPMLATVRRPIGPDETSEDIERDLAQLGASLLVSTVGDVAEGRIVEQPQDDSLATYAPRLTKDEGVIDWALSAQKLHNLIRGLHPWPHAVTYHRNRRLILHRSAVLTDVNGEPGAVLESQGDHLHVATGRGALAITEIQPEGRRTMPTRDFLAGHQVAVGDQLTTHP
jgi:methionyl-tRNA formyltransferase